MKMVQDAGSPSLQKQTVKPESLRGMESCYENVLVKLGRIIKVKDFLSFILCAIQTLKYCENLFIIINLILAFIMLC